MSGERSTTTADVQVVACPKCSAQFMFRRSYTPRIDACGFESYRLECKQCGAAFAGIIDPYDETLLLSDTAGADHQRRHDSRRRAAR